MIGTITDHERLGRLRSKGVQCELEDRPIGLLDPMLERENEAVDKLGEALSVKLRSEIKMDIADHRDLDPVACEALKRLSRVGGIWVTVGSEIQLVEGPGEILFEPSCSKDLQGGLRMKSR